MNKLSTAVVIYHANCFDGFTSAWIAESTLSLDNEVELIPANYGDPLPLDAIDSDTTVYVLDFSYSREATISLAEHAAKVIVIDHHASAIQALADLYHPKLQLLLDSSAAGCVLTWNWFRPEEPIPELVLRIGDRDTWTFAYPGTREYVAAVGLKDFTLENWDELARTDPEDLMELGAIVCQHEDKQIALLLESAVFWTDFMGHKVVAANAPYFLASELGMELCRQYPGSPFSICFHTSVDGTKLSLRSLPGGADVSKIAKKLGGGGHKHAAGCTMPHPLVPSHGDWDA